MGSTVSGTLAEIYLQHIELYIKHWMSTEITYSKRYVDDIIFNKNK